MAPRRRTILAAASAATASALAGCSGDLFADGGDDGTGAAADAAADFVHGLVDDEFAALREEFIPEFREEFAPLGRLEQFRTGLTAVGGGFDEIVETSATKGEEGYTATMVVAFERSRHLLQLGLDEEHRYGEYRIGDRYERPSYVDPDAFAEEEVTLETDADDCSLPGRVTVPEDASDVPGVVLVHRGGQIPMDNQTQTFATGLFKDLAEGLATRGIASIRYDKRTFECDLAGDEHDLESVTVDDALTAAEELRSVEGVDSDRIVVVGHELGGLAAPRIAERDGSLAGIVGLSAPARPFQEVVLQKQRHKATAGEHEWPSAADRYERWADEIDRLSEGDYESDERLLGYYGSFWESLEAYDQVDSAADLDLPAFFLQGERAFEVTVDDDLEEWESAVGDRDDSSVEAYDGLNFYLMPGEGPSVPFEYDLQNNADERVVEDIAAWIEDR